MDGAAAVDGVDGAEGMDQRCCGGEVRRELGFHSIRPLLLQLRGKGGCCGPKAAAAGEDGVVAEGGSVEEK